ncbi:MAG: alpha/beta hydrolase [Chloroflexi bacterium]|nr:alpha/beta hydrolase [Chloroflexota bacterium]
MAGNTKNRGIVHLYSKYPRPKLIIKQKNGATRSLPFRRAGPGRRPGEYQWLVEPPLPEQQQWSFRINPNWKRTFATRLSNIWIQDGELFGYQPAAFVSPSRVVKLRRFKGSLPARSLYIYLPRGYDEHGDRRYPVIYMHDGQNCFEKFVADSYAGSWRADETAGSLISAGRMRECIIVAVSNSNGERLAEYLPPYVTFERPLPLKDNVIGKMKKTREVPAEVIHGRADLTAAYYQEEVATYINRRYRILGGREHTATCGSSMAALFSTYLAWEYPDFARQHALLSPAYHVTGDSEGRSETLERLRSQPRRDVRLWLDSGTLDAPGRGDDDMINTQKARDALLENGYVIGEDMQYYLDEGGTHHESAWAVRLPKVFEFLFPLLEGD